ncbi:HipA family kinase [Gracilibacillus dipsosauri]|uniref:HipA-like kinase domain-containing protein n=1 Tax=Gracilibacillus dipsosauri TaxID=178340 RepID=A0A317KZW9_9BACI|nr:HipA family kinase [Gracilibacillus dipsosauri]PWU68330.1 hypothetical protein DLJ74_07720 [Gracilibacillus dipsosauri]
MVKRIEIQTFLSYLGEGISEPALVIGDDFNKYILKTQKVRRNGKTEEFNCMFLNEFLSFKIAEYLSVPIPEVAIANISQDLIENDSTITFVHKFNEGDYFASSEIKDKEENLMENYRDQLRMGRPYTIRSWNKFFEDITNPMDLPNIIAFDLLISNFDRYDNAGNLLVANPMNERKIFTIDHGHAFFGPVWNTWKINQLRQASLTKEYVEYFVNFILNQNNNGDANNPKLFANGFGEVFRAIENYVDLNNLSEHSFMDIVAHIENIDGDTIDEWFLEIPDTWFVDKLNQIAYYKRFLMEQKNIIRYILQEMAYRRAFSNYRGGALEWKERKQTGTV